MIAFEQILRLAQPNLAGSAVGLGLTAAGCGMLVSLTKSKPYDHNKIPQNLAEAMSAAGVTDAVLVNKKDQSFIGVVWFLFFAFLAIWLLLLVKSLGATLPPYWSSWSDFSISIVGAIIFLVCVGLTEVKETI